MINNSRDRRRFAEGFLPTPFADWQSKQPTLCEIKIGLRLANVNATLLI
jgi:hypothetical protein